MGPQTCQVAHPSRRALPRPPQGGVYSWGSAMRVVITGASRGIGRATALKLAADGVEALTLCDVAYLDELEALATNLRTSGCKVRTLRADMAKPNDPARV